MVNPRLLLVAASLLLGVAPARAQIPGCTLVEGFNERCQEWASTYDDGTGTLDVPAAVAASPDGERVYVTGINYVPGQAHPMFDSTTIAYSASTGAKLWEHRFDNVPDTWDQMHDIAVSPDGSHVFVTGLGGLDFRGGGDFVLIAYHADTGTPDWVGRYDGGTIDEALALTVAEDGERIYVTGVSLGDGTDRDYATVGFDAATGALLWSARYDGPASAVDQPVDVAVTPEGDQVFVTGWSLGQSDDDFTTIAYESADEEHLGEELWLHRHDGGGRDRPAGLAVDPDGSRVYVTGESAATGGASEAATVAYEAGDGDKAWETRLGAEVGAAATAITTDGSLVYVAGWVENAPAEHPDRNVLTVAYTAATGGRAWLAMPGSPAFQDAATAMGISADGEELYVTGSSYPQLQGIRTGFLTLALRADDGGQRWMARYHSDSLLTYEEPVDLAVDPAGERLFLTGYSSTGPTADAIPRGFDDYVTVAYNLSPSAQPRWS